MTSHKFAIRRANAPATERAYVGLFNETEAKRLGQQYADSDHAPVTIVLDESSGRRSRDLYQIDPTTGGQGVASPRRS